MIKHVLHLKAPGNWINDPNGFIYYKGRYHLFYQHFPYAPVWGTMHWGHAVSDDLVHWEHIGIAVFPTKDYDRNGIFSGSAIEKDGELFLYYSAVRYLCEEDENIHHAQEEQFETSQAMITSLDGEHFDNWQDKRQIIPVIRDMQIGDCTHTRDPKVWRDGENYYMVLGSTFKGKTGRILFYKSPDAVNWEYAGGYQDERFGKILECPDIFSVDGKGIFVGSPMAMMKDGLLYPDQSVCALAEFDPAVCKIKHMGTFQHVDYGMDLYAPQTNVDKEGRRVMIAWMRMPKAAEEPGGRAWNGLMCQPRVVEVDDGFICFRVHPAVDKYFSKELADLTKIDSRRPIRIKTTLKDGESLDIGGYRLWAEGNRIMADRSRVFDGITGYRLVSSTPEIAGEAELDIFVDENLIEVFVNGGRYVISHVVYGLKSAITGRAEQIFTGE